MSDPRLKEVEASLRETAKDPFGFEALVDRWNAVFDEDELGQAKVSAELDKAVGETFDLIASDAGGQAVSHRMRQVLNTISHPALAIRADGLVAAMNDAAFERLDVDPGMNVDEIDYALEDGIPITEAVAQALRGRNAQSDVSVRRAFHGSSDRSASFVIVPSVEDGVSQALLFIIDPVWRAEVEAFLSRAYTLTTSEAGVLMAFLDGHGLKDIAAQRGTSYATVRTQLHSVMAKTGSRSQAELMRNTVAVSEFFNTMGNVAEIARHPNRKRFSIFGQGGRTIDILAAGDLGGDLVVSLADATLFGHVASVEAAFRAAGLCVVSLCRPGLGQTEPPPEGVDYLDCLEADLRDVIRQLGRKRAVLLGHNTSSVFAYALAARGGDVLSSVVIKSTLVPAPMLNGAGVRSSWARALMRAMQSSSGMYRIIIFAAIKAWKAMGSRRMLLMQLRGFKPDEEVGARRDVVEAYDQAMRATLSQGPDYATYSFKLASEDWSQWVAEARVPIHLIHARHDPSSSFEAVGRFAESHPEQITTHLIEDGGYMTFQTHTDRLLAILKGATG